MLRCVPALKRVQGHAQMLGGLGKRTFFLRIPCRFQHYHRAGPEFIIVPSALSGHLATLLISPLK